MVISFVFINLFKKTGFSQKKGLTLKLGSAALIGGQGKYM
jgi:hypothetical protein